MKDRVLKDTNTKYNVNLKGGGCNIPHIFPYICNRKWNCLLAHGNGSGKDPTGKAL